MIETIKEVIEKRLGTPEFEVKIESSPDRGHISTNAAFILAEKENLKLPEAAEEMRSYLHKHAPTDYFERIEIAGGGFVNIWLKPGVVRAEFKKILAAGNKWGKAKGKKKELVIVEYSAPNIAKRMHVGHLRSTIIGDAIANIFEHQGWKTIRWNYIGDWGTQFGRLIAAYKLWGERRKVKKAPIEELEKLYIKFHEELKRQPELEARGREEFRKLEAGDKTNRTLWRWFKKVSLRDFGKIYNRLGISFSTQIAESYYEKDLPGIIERLKEEGLAKESEGALMVDLERFGLPPAMVKKSDESTLYLTRDIANAKYRIEEYDPEKILYVVANEQALHFSQLFAITSMFDWDDRELPEFSHVKFGLVRGEKGKLSTREGTAAKLTDLLDRAVALAEKALEERGVKFGKSEMREVAEAVGVGAVKYNDLSQNRLSDIVFDWDRMISFEGNSGPYLQYTYARLRSIMRKAKRIPKANLTELKEEKDISLVLKLAEFPSVIERVLISYFPHYLATYLYELSREINSYYQSEPVLYSEPKLRAVRLNLVKATSDTLKVGLELLGIKAVERM